MSKWNKFFAWASVVMITTIAFFMVISPRASAGTPVGGDITSDTAWVIEGSPYWVESDVIVRNGANLSIEVGVDVLFNGSYSIYIEVGGVLFIVRTAPHRPYALFSWNLGTGLLPYPGIWRAIQFNDSSYDTSYIMASVIEYAHYGIRLESASPAIINNTIRNCTYGIYSNYGSPTIEDNTIENCVEDGIHIVGDDPAGTGFVNIKNNSVRNNYYGIYSDQSAPQIKNNTIVNNIEDGVHIIGNNPSGGYANLENNTVYNNTKRGIVLYDVENVRLRNNNISSSSYNFGVWADTQSEFDHDIDTTNIVNQKPIYYWRNHEHDDESIPSDAGYVGIVNSTSITAENLTLTHNGQGALVAYSNYTNINNVSASDNELGIILFSSPNNTIRNSNISNNDYNGYYPLGHGASGIYLHLSLNNNITGNNVSSNIRTGIYTTQSSNNNITSNSALSNNWCGIDIYASSNNNSIIDNNVSFNIYNGIHLDNSNDNNVMSNKVNSNIDYGIPIIDYCYRNNIIGNTVLNNENGVLLMSSGNSNITGNTFSNSKHGISLVVSSGNNVTSNNILNNERGIDTFLTFNNNINNNSVLNNEYGIYLYHSSNNNISYCNITSNDEDGVYLNGDFPNDIYNNKITWNDRAGIYCLYSSDPTITYNDILNNEYGVLSGGGSDPTIHNNTISGNTEYGIKNVDSGVYIHAEYNWWGEDDNSGPYKDDWGPPVPYDNLDGTGDEVSKYVYFTSWLDGPP